VTWDVTKHRREITGEKKTHHEKKNIMLKTWRISSSVIKLCGVISINNNNRMQHMWHQYQYAARNALAGISGGRKAKNKEKQAALCNDSSVKKHVSMT